MKITKLGTIETDIVESNPIVWKGKLYRFDYIRADRGNRNYCGRADRSSYFRFVDVATNEVVTTFGSGLHMGSAFTNGEKIVVTCIDRWGGDKFLQLESTDMVNWSEPRVILENPEWSCYNTTICFDGEKYILTFELGKPSALVGEPFTMFFAQSYDLSKWEMIPDAIFGYDFYTGGPMIRYHAPFYYLFYLDGSYENGFREAVARSRDLKNWEYGNRYVLTYDEDDRKVYGDFSAQELEAIRTAANYNNSDLDMCEWQDKLFMTYSWGNQRGIEFLALAETKCSERDFCVSFFDNKEEKK